MRIKIAKTVFLITLWGSMYALYTMNVDAVQEHTQKVKQALHKAKSKQEIKKVYNSLVNCETDQCVGGMTFSKRYNIFMQIAKQEKINTSGM